MMKILVTNDDGIDAVGLTVLAERLSEIAEVYVAAPVSQQSGKSHGITFLTDVGAEPREVKGASWAYAVEGTPADCVKWGLFRFRADGIMPDYVLSGINLGPNTGMSAYYSGTIAAAREGAVNGIRSIALSLCSHDATHFGYLLDMLPKLIEMSASMEPSSIMSVNAPDLPEDEVKGVRIVPAAPYGYGEDFVFSDAGYGRYQMHPVGTGQDGRMRYDFDWVKAGCAAISPIPTTLEDSASLMRLRGFVRTAQSLVVIVDAQEAALERIRKPKKFLKNTGRFVHAAARMGMPMIFTETYGQGDTAGAVMKYAEGAETVERILPDAWSSPEMSRLMGALDIQEVLIAGTGTHTAVMQTALGFLDRGYEVTLIEDCCSASTKNDHQTAVETLRSAGCRISTSEAAVISIAGSCEKGIREAAERIIRGE